MTDQPAPLGARAVLRIPDYRRLWAAQGVSDIGDALTSLTLLIVVTRLTGSTAALAAMAIALAVPAIVVGPIAGVFVDRWDRRRVMLASDLIRAGLVLGFILVASTDRLWLMYVIAIAHATVGTFFTPSRMALIPRVVPREGLMAANSLNQLTRVLAAVFGSALAGDHRRPGRRVLAGLHDRCADVPALVRPGPRRPHQRTGRGVGPRRARERRRLRFAQGRALDRRPVAGPARDDDRGRRDDARPGCRQRPVRAAHDPRAPGAGDVARRGRWRPDPLDDPGRRPRRRARRPPPAHDADRHRPCRYRRVRRPRSPA